MINENPIGIFDSGIGGLAIAHRIRELLPNENLLYLADSAHAPYGEKTASYITQRASSIVQFLLEHGAKTIVVACNTATVSSIQALRHQYTIPIVGVEPGIKPAAFKTKSGVIGVLATTQTISSSSFNNLARGFSTQVKVEVQPCPGLMEQVEALEFDSHHTKKLVKIYLEPLLAKGADHIVLGCTHYTFLAPIIKNLVGPKIEVITTDLAVARETSRRLDAENLLSKKIGLGDIKFWSSAVSAVTNKQFSQLWEEPVDVSPM